VSFLLFALLSYTDLTVKYPTFRLLNKQGRVALSSQPLNLKPAVTYRLFAVANLKGWFAAATYDDNNVSCTFSPRFPFHSNLKQSNPALIFSPLQDLNSSFKTTSQNNNNNNNNSTFTPKRKLALGSESPNIVTFACSDTRLIVGFERGQLTVYDTSLLFSHGSDNASIAPMHVLLDVHAGPIRHILPNPGTEFPDAVVVVRENAQVQLLNIRLESQGGWIGAGDSTPVAGIVTSPRLKPPPNFFFTQPLGHLKANT
jgi:nucleoporin NUP159